MSEEPSDPGPGDLLDRDALQLGAARGALQRWATFPVRAEPRPLVLLPGQVVRARGFPTVDAKMAFELGRIVADDGVPEEPVRALRKCGEAVMERWPPHDARLVRLKRAETTGMPLLPLRVIEAEVSEAPYDTDRGRATLPAWRVQVLDAISPIWVLTEQTLNRSWSPPGEAMLAGCSATIDADGVGMTLSFVGAQEDAFRYDTVVLETDTAVTVALLNRPTGKSPPGTAFTLQGHRRSVSVRLEHVLANRVLVDPQSGGPASVVSAA